jgi:FMN-binding domain
MHRRSLLQLSAFGAGLTAVPWARSESYLSVEDAQALIFPNAPLQQIMIAISASDAKAIKSRSKMTVHQLNPKLWKSAAGDWFWLDQVIGKHEFIDVAIGIGHEGGIRGIEILTYRESYGGEIRNPKWRSQFTGKTPASVPLKLDGPIKNITGATLSCRHITDAVNRWLATWDLVLRKHT